MAGDRQIKFTFLGDGGVLKGSVGELRALFGSLVNDVDDIRTAGEKWADAYSQQSARIKQDMDDVETTARVLADSLGPQMVQALDQSGRSVEQQVQEFIKLGLTHDDIRASSDELAAALKQRDDVLRQSAGEIGDGFRKVSAEADNSRSVLANMVGNSAQDLGELAGIGGTAGVALGQLAEQAAEGQISLAGLGKTIGPMIVLGGVMQLLAADQARAAREARALKEAQEALAEGNVADAAASLVESYQGLYDWAEKLGISTDTVTAAITGNDEAFNEIRLTVAHYAVDLRNLDPAMQGLVSATGSQVPLLGKAREAWSATATELVRNEQLTNDVAAALTQATGVVQDNTAAVREAERAQRDLVDARMSSIDSGFAVVDAQDQYTSALERAAVAQDDSTTGVNEWQQAQDQAARAAYDVAQAVAADAEAKAAANGQTLTATESNKLMIQSLYQTLVSLGPNSPLRGAIIGYINTLQGVPKSATTAVGVTGTEDSLDRIGGVKRSADDLADTEIDVDAAATVDKAVAEVDRLQVKIGDTPEQVSTTFVMNTGSAMSALEALRQKMLAVKSAADAAERAVARVAD